MALPDEPDHRYKYMQALYRAVQQLSLRHYCLALGTHAQVLGDC